MLIMIPLTGSISFATGISNFKFDPTDLILMHHFCEESVSKLDSPERKDDSLNFQMGVHLFSLWKRLFWDASFFCAIYKTNVFFCSAAHCPGLEAYGATSISSFFTWGAQFKLGYRYRPYLPGLYFTLGFSNMILSIEDIAIENEENNNLEKSNPIKRFYATPFWGGGLTFPVVKMCDAFIEFQHKISPSQKIDKDSSFFKKIGQDVEPIINDFSEKRKRAPKVKLAHWRILCGVQFHLWRNTNAV